MKTNRRNFLGYVTAFLMLPTQVSAQDRGLPPAVKRALGRYQGATVTSVRIRRDAPTAQGFMYEVNLRGPGSSARIIYVDPDSGKVLFESEGGR